MVSSHKVAQSWAEGKKATGHNIFTDGRTIWSFGEHFPCATYGLKLGKKVVLFNTSTYSPTTGKHQSYVRNAIPNEMEVIKVNTEEIKKVVNYCTEKQEIPIVIVEGISTSNITDIKDCLNQLRYLCREKGMKRFPYKEVERMILHKLFVQNI